MVEYVFWGEFVMGVILLYHIASVANFQHVYV
jgi:hypothetical protein